MTFLRPLLLILFTAGLLQAAEYRAVFDCGSSDARYIASRLALVEKTMEMLEARGDTPVFALTLHGGCVAAASENYEYVVAEKDVLWIARAQKSLVRLGKRKVEVVACAIAMEAAAIDEEDILPFIRISPNSYIDTIGYQNRGYALMPLR